MSGAAMVVERATFVALGGFDENLFLYKEDEDLCLRLRRARRPGDLRAGGGDPPPRVGRSGPATRSSPVASSYLLREALCGPTIACAAFAAVHRSLAYVRL